MHLKYLFGASALALGALVLPLGAPAALAQTMPAPPVTFYGDLPAIEEAEVSPQGTYTALLMTTGGERVISVLDAAGNPVKQLAVGDAKVRTIEWVGEDAILLLRTETGRTPDRWTGQKREYLRGNVIPLDDARPVVSIFSGQRSVANTISTFDGIRMVDGRWTGFFGGLRMGNANGERNVVLDRYQPALYAVDLLTGDIEIVAYPDDWPATRRWLVDESGKVGAVRQLDTANGNWRIENASGTTIARGQQERGEVSLIGFDASGTSVIYSYYDDEYGGSRRFSVPLAGGTPIELWKDEVIRTFIYQPYSGRVLGIQRESDASIELADPQAQQVLSDTLEKFSFASWSRIAGFTPDFSALVATTSGNYDSGTWYRVDAATGARSILGLEYPAIQGPVIGPVSTFEYTAQDGLELEAILTLPPGREPRDLPVVVLPHGGPTAHDIEAFNWKAQAFAARGYAVVQPNFRGSTGRGAALLDAGDGEWGKKMQSDKSDALAALAEAGIVDPKRACIVGSSYGGYAALAGVTLQQGIYACAVSVNGIADLQPIMRDLRSGRRDIVTRSVDRQFGGRVDLDELSPAKFAGRADAPVLLIHARGDSVVPYEQSVIMQDALTDAGKPVEFLTLEGEDHWLSSAATRKQMLEAAVAFVERHNPPD